MRSLRHILSAEATLAGYLERRRSELAILEHIRRNLPPALAAQVGIAAGEPPELALLAGSGAAGALLRQRIPDLVEKLAREGWQFTGIRIRVQPLPAARSRKKIDAKQLDNDSIATLRAHAALLPDADLAGALRRLADQADQADSAKETQALERVEKKRPE
jgi:hypothetical protein